MFENAVIPYRVYRHFKGGMYLVLSISTDVDDPIGDRLVVYKSLNGDENIWSRSYSEFISDVPEDKPNPTGQKKRFELVTDFGNTLSLVSTENLLKELMSRPDSPLCEFDLEGFNSKVFSKEYLLGVPHDSDSYSGAYIEPIVVGYDDKEGVENFLSHNPIRMRPGAKIYKRVYIEVESFD